VASAAAAALAKNPEWPSRLTTAPDKAASAADLPVRAVTTHISVSVVEPAGKPAIQRPLQPVADVNIGRVAYLTGRVKHPHMPVGLQEDIQGAILRPALDQAQRPYLGLDPPNRDRTGPAGGVHREHRLAPPRSLK
jgi:hypothetical protein